MTVYRLVLALLAVIWGNAVCARRKQPLFFKILLFGCGSFLFGAMFEGCWTLVYGEPPQGFHIGYLGYAGAFFFLLSAHYGAIDRLADGGEKQYRPYRLAALIAPALVIIVTLLGVFGADGRIRLTSLIIAVPMGIESYFALKHLLLPDVEMGIIRVMRPYNFCIVLLCMAELLSYASIFPAQVNHWAGYMACTLFAVALPLAEMGVRKWYI